MLRSCGAVLCLLLAGAPIAAAPGGAAAPEGPPPLIPVEDFYRNPEMTSVFISPDGSYISYLAPYEGRLNIHVRDMATGEVWHVTTAADRDITWDFWGGRSRIVYLRDGAGDENWRL